MVATATVVVVMLYSHMIVSESSKSNNIRVPTFPEGGVWLYFGLFRGRYLR